MNCIVLPVSALRRRYSDSWRSSRRLSYQPLAEEGNDDDDEAGVRVVVGVGEEKSEFLVDPSVLQEDPFRMLMDMVMSKEEHCKRINRKNVYKNAGEKGKVIFIKVDAILFDHMLWLMQNDASSFLQLNLREIVDFYS